MRALRDHDRRIAVLSALRRPTARQRTELLRLQFCRDDRWRALPRHVTRLRRLLSELEGYAALHHIPLR